MKSLIASLLLLATLISLHAQPRYVTMAGKAIGGVLATNTLEVGQFETAELVSFPWTINNGSQDPTSAGITILKDGVESRYYVKIISATTPTALDPLVVAGPATIRLISPAQGAQATFRLIPESFPPDRTLLIPPGTNQVRLTLECSTNLVEWFPATNGVYGPLPVAKFFRIKLDRFVPE